MRLDTPSGPRTAPILLDVIGLMGLMRVAMFEAFGDRRFWDERFYDLFTAMLVKQLQGSVSTLEEMTAAVSGVSYSTKVRMIEEARAAGVIEAANRSEVHLDQPLESPSARKVFFLAPEAMDRMVEALNDIVGDVETFVAQHARGGK